jgi:phosphatidylinositol 4-phosphatase
LNIYEKQVCINLINHHGSEGKLERTFSQVLKTIDNPSIKYETFDFHKQCGADKWDRLSILINRLAVDQDQFGYFLATKQSNPTVLQNQRGVFRTNCIDCLDRTNVVQSLLAKRILHIQLIKLLILTENESIELHANLNDIFRNVWADNGDTMSIQYAGTGALKSDFTRLGQRTYYGLLRDGTNSLHRYFLNNFYDGFKQDSLDLFLGNYQVSPNECKKVEQCPVANELDKRYLFLPIIGLAAFTMFFISIIFPADTYQEQLLFILFWGLSTFATLGISLYFGNEIVNAPRLVHIPKHKKNKSISKNE